MINPSEFNFVTVQCYVPSSVFSGALIQFFTYVQNLNFQQLFMYRLKHLTGSVLSLFLQAPGNALSLQVPSPLELPSPPTRDVKKDFQ